MRSDVEIVTKMRLLDSPGWLEGEVARNLLNEYHMGVRTMREGALTQDLRVEVFTILEHLLNDDEVRAKYSLVRCQIIVWLLGDDALMQKIHKVQLGEGFVEKRLDLIRKFYGIEVPTGQSEEE